MVIHVKPKVGEKFRIEPTIGKRFMIDIVGSRQYDQLGFKGTVFVGVLHEWDNDKISWRPVETKFWDQNGQCYSDITTRSHFYDMPEKTPRVVWIAEMLDTGELTSDGEAGPHGVWWKDPERARTSVTKPRKFVEVLED